MPVGGRWRLRAEDPALAEVARTVHTLLAPHLGARLLPLGDEDGATALGDDGGTRDLTLALRTDEGPYGPVARGVSPAGLDVPADESYRLTVDATGLHCRATTPEGLFRAAASALQLLATAAHSPGQTLPAQEFTDAPHFAWRGLLIDPARGFLRPAEVRQLIDLAALYKLNVVHLHLTDNEGWRIELPGLPRLTAGEAPFYTADEYGELQRYAAARFVTLVPEIDLPGHCAALRAAVPGLPAAPCPEGLAGRFPFVPPLDLADPGTRALVEEIFAGVCALTEGPYVHIGADEAVGMTGESFAVAVRALRAAVRAHGKRPLGWQESSRAGITPDDLAQFWVDVPMMELPGSQEELEARPELLRHGWTLELAQAMGRFFAPADGDLGRILAGGGKVLLSPQCHLYLDRAYDIAIVPPAQAADASRLGFPSYRHRDVAYTAAWEPHTHGVPPERIAGVEATVFGESVTSLADVVLLLLPRLPAAAETAWCGGPSPWEEYRARLAPHTHVWRARDLAHLATTEVAWE
nr:family 20 glycosylhydrolase [Streptomyces sp. SID8380]